MILLSVKAGLRAGEIAKLTWSMLLDTDGRIADCIELHDSAAKKGQRTDYPTPAGFTSRIAAAPPRIGNRRRGDPVRASRLARHEPLEHRQWFWHLYADLGLAECSSHSGRRTFITQTARLVFKADGSLRDVQQLGDIAQSIKPRPTSTTANVRSDG
jgi:integrase